jgi:hypothetical protein
LRNGRNKNQKTEEKQKKNRRKTEEKQKKNKLRKKRIDQPKDLLDDQWQR